MPHEPRAYYNEHDPYAAAWLENLIQAGEIADGDVDTRSILDVLPADLDGYTQCHFFAGVGIWSRALREAGWPDDRPVWTGSCPCQPFSAAGAGLGVHDDRHLFPGWQWLIEQQRPETVFGEQVASADGLGWADLVQAAMEASGYACGFVDTCAAGFRSFHIRQRLYFAAEDCGSATDDWQTVVRRFGGLVHSQRARSQGHGGHGDGGCEPGRVNAQPAGPVAEAGPIGWIPHADGSERRAQDHRRSTADREEAGRIEGADRAGELCCIDVLADADGGHSGAEWQQCSGQFGQFAPDSGGGHCDIRADPADGYWRAADWLFCRDGKWRPVGPGTFPLAHAAPARMGRLRAYGNGLDLAQATGFIRAYMERDMGNQRPMPGNLFEWGV